MAITENLPMEKNETDAQREWRWKVEQAADTAIQYEKNKKDKKLMAAVKIELKKRLESTKKAVTDTQTAISKT